MSHVSLEGVAQALALFHELKVWLCRAHPLPDVHVRYSKVCVCVRVCVCVCVCVCAVCVCV